MNHGTSLTGPLRTVIAGKYRLEQVLGSGATGTVYRATHTWTERQVALKLLSPALANHGSLRERFLREARASVRLHHANVVDVLDMGETEDESIYMAMELLHGDTLRAELQDLGSLTPERTLFILTPLLSALELAPRSQTREHHDERRRGGT